MNTNYRITDSIIANSPELCAEFAKLGIRDYANALEPRHRSVHTQVFVMVDGSVVRSDIRIVAQAYRAARAGKGTQS